MPNQYFIHYTPAGQAVRCRVFIRSDTDGVNSRGLVAVFNPEPEKDPEILERRRRLSREVKTKIYQGSPDAFDALCRSIEARRVPTPESIRSTDAADLVRALAEAGVPKSAVVFECPETDNSDGALSRKQFASVQEAMSDYPTRGDQTPDAPSAA